MALIAVGHQVPTADVGLLANVWLPTGEPAAFQGESLRAEPRLAADWANGDGWSGAVNLGFLMRDSQTVENLEIVNQVTYALGLRVPIVRGDATDALPALQGLISMATSPEPTATPRNTSLSARGWALPPTSGSSLALAPASSKATDARFPCSFWPSLSHGEEHPTATATSPHR
jgi:hypothetical protein